MNLIEIKAPGEAIQLDSLIRKYFSKHLKGRDAERFLKEGHIYLANRKETRWKTRVKANSKLILVGDLQLQNSTICSEDIVFENKSLVIWNKPHGLPTQGTMKRHEANLYDWARLFYLEQKKFPTGLPYVGLHHRLDRDTSGLVLMSKQRSANKELSDLFKNRQIEKSYLACVEWGEKIPDKQWTFKSLIKRGQGKNFPFQFFVDDKVGDEAITEFRLVKSEEGKCHWIECFPKTGRTHQLRVHLSHLGWPILGDRVYGHKDSAPRLMLHAQRLKFLFQGQVIECEAPMSNTEGLSI